ncbi:hypothetical protein FB451DRAFT_1402706 [Mycena latifolia]|nr:hypothetical protein FB451DRAFT_1402706 [Mycena latifolia]
MAEPPLESQPNGRDTAPKTTIHNDIIKHFPDLSDLSPLRAFSPAVLKDMGHKRVAELFVARFARVDDYVETPPGMEWFIAGAKRHAPAVEFLAARGG